jgi:hypothetical protein
MYVKDSVLWRARQCGTMVDVSQVMITHTIMDRRIQFRLPHLLRHRSPRARWHQKNQLWRLEELGHVQPHYATQRWITATTITGETVNIINVYQSCKTKTRLKMEDIVPHLTTVNEICFPLAEQILADHQKGSITGGEGVVLLLDTRMTTLLHHQPVCVTQRTKVKLQTHRNEEQRESKVQIVTLQKSLDKPLHNKCLSM